MNQKHKQSKLKLTQKLRLQGKKKKNKFAKNPSNPANLTPQPNSLNHQHPTTPTNYHLEHHQNQCCHESSPKNLDQEAKKKRKKKGNKIMRRGSFHLT